MKKLRIRTYSGNSESPDKTITVPMGMARIAAKLIPANISAKLAEKGVDIVALINAVKEEDVCGVLTEIDDHVKQEKIIVSIEQ